MEKTKLDEAFSKAALERTMVSKVSYAQSTRSHILILKKVVM